MAALTAASVGGWVFAQGQPAKELRAVVWGRAREATGSYRTITDISGLVEVDSNVPKNIDAEDLRAVCQARDEGVRRARVLNEQLINAIGLDDDPTTSENRALTRTHLASIATYLGDVAHSIDELKKARQALAPFATAEYPDLTKKYLGIDEMLGAMYLRSGEVENCMLMPNADRCIFPIMPGGIHSKKEGALAAGEVFREYLEGLPGRPRSAVAAESVVHAGRHVSAGRARGGLAQTRIVPVGSPPAEIRGRGGLNRPRCA